MTGIEDSGVQCLRKIGACENRQAQADTWKGAAIDPCPAPAAFLCEVCGFLLCGGHAGGHWHESSSPKLVASYFQSQASAAQADAAAARADAGRLQQQLTAAQKDCERVAQIKELLTAGA
jgi:hypothetical protein